MPYRDSPHQEFEILMSFDYLHLFRPNEHTDDYYLRKPNTENSLFKIEDKKFIHVRENFFSFETSEEITEYFSENGFSVIKFTFAHGKKNYFLLHQKYIPLQEYENLTMKNEYLYLYKKDEELKGDNITVKNEGIVEYGNDFLFVKLFTPNNKYTLLSKTTNTDNASSIFRKISQNRDYIQTFCNKRRNPFHFTCRQWYSYNNPQCDMV